jgi:hypothetical protein
MDVRRCAGWVVMFVLESERVFAVERTGLRAEGDEGGGFGGVVGDGARFCGLRRGALRDRRRPGTRVGRAGPMAVDWRGVAERLWFSGRLWATRGVC